MIQKDITYCGQAAVVVCDGKCVKAWGINNRPKLQIDPTNEDDVVWLADSELGDAPADPGTYEGFEGKPTCVAEHMNKWCVRECERSSMFRPDEEVVVKDWSKRIANIPGREDVIKDVTVEVYGMDFMKLIVQDSETPERWPKVIASNTFTAQTLLKNVGNGRLGVITRSVAINEYEDGRRVISFGWPWEYGEYIFTGYDPVVAKMVEGTNLEKTARVQPDQTEGRWMLDMGSGGQEVWLEPEEARRVFSWARPFMVREEKVDDRRDDCSGDNQSE